MNAKNLHVGHWVCGLKNELNVARNTTNAWRRQGRGTVNRKIAIWSATRTRPALRTHSEYHRSRRSLKCNLFWQPKINFKHKAYVRTTRTSSALGFGPVSLLQIRFDFLLYILRDAGAPGDGFIKLQTTTRIQTQSKGNF